jgi:hypothetical protein
MKMKICKAKERKNQEDLNFNQHQWQEFKSLIFTNSLRNVIGKSKIKNIPTV